MHCGIRRGSELPPGSRPRGRAASAATSGLSPRETEVLRCLADGASNKMIARKFDLAEATVKVHVKAVLRKLKLGNRTQAAMWASERGLILERST